MPTLGLLRADSQLSLPLWMPPLSFPANRDYTVFCFPNYLCKCLYLPCYKCIYFSLLNCEVFKAKRVSTFWQLFAGGPLCLVTLAKLYSK